MNSSVTLAVAGSRKTQSIVNRCASGKPCRRLALTLTTAGQEELTRRLEQHCPADQLPEVAGWFSFLLNNWVKPYVPDLFPGRRVTGFSFDGAQEEGAQYRKGAPRFLSADGLAYRRYLAKFAYDVAVASRGAVLDRLSRIYDEIYIDEVQDLVGWDLELLELMLKFPITLQMVGDPRQSLISTNERDPKNPEFRGLGLTRWFEQQEKAGRLTVEHSNTTYRSIQAIADFADTIFSTNHGFKPTISRNDTVTFHDGLFTVSKHDFPEYKAQFNPQCLNDNLLRGAGIDADFQTFGIVKGLTWEHVAIAPTNTVIDFIAKGKPLKDKTACGLYVAVTRARQSVAFILDDPGRLRSLRQWAP